MNCAKHTDVPAAAYCRTCGKALCPACKRDVRGVLYCEECLATRLPELTAANAPVYTGRPLTGPNPVVAGVLSVFPFGVGQVYNGQYSRGLAHLMVFIALIWGANHAGAADFAFGLGIPAFIIYQIIDAVRSARCLQMGIAPPDPFGFDNILGPSGKPQVAQSAPISSVQPATPQAPADAAAPMPGSDLAATSSSSVPLGAVILIALGAMFLFGNLGMFRFFWIGDFWPIILVVVGGWLLMNRWDEITSGTARGRRHLMWPAVLLVLGGTFLLDNIGRVGFHRTWPLLLIVIGLVMFWIRTTPDSQPLPQAGTAAPETNATPQPPVVSEPIEPTSAPERDQEER